MELPPSVQLDCVCFTLIIDDIVLPDGRTFMQQLGGGGSQSLFGFQLVNGKNSAAGLAAGVGGDLPAECKDWLKDMGVDTSGLELHARPTPRAWQVFEADGRRTQIWRRNGDPCDELYEMLRPKFDTLPKHFQTARNFHIGVHPLHPPLKLLRTLRQAAHASGGLLSVEPYTAAEQPATAEQVSQLLAVCDIFSPNEMEMESMVGPMNGSPEEGLIRLLDAGGPSGAATVVLRRGEKGVLAAARMPQEDSSSGRLAWTGFQVPAVADTHVVDVTGCGNAFCGGFLAAVHRTGDLQESALWGCVASSFMAEAHGVPRTPLDTLQDQAQRRLDALRPRVRHVDLSKFRKPPRSQCRAIASLPSKYMGSFSRETRQSCLCC